MTNVCTTSILVIVAALVMPGCDSAPRLDQLSEAPDTAQRAVGGPEMMPDEPTLTVRQGLQIRRLVIPRDDAQLSNALASAAAQPALEAALSERWSQNGLMMVQLSPSDVDAFIGRLGAPMIDRDEWHGEILEWSPVQNSVTDSLRAVAVDQRIERFRAGEFELLARGWTLPMEAGSRLYLEMLPRYHQPQNVNYLDLVADEETGLQGTVLTSLAASIELQPDVAYVITGIGPTGSPSEGESTPRRTSGRGPGAGPVTAAPVSLGALLMFRDAPPARRTLMVLQLKSGQSGAMQVREAGQR